jgi:crotonobetainyl-CoA:carnitine CoA-transferase CaiB-like acyl-CoA transferase
VLERPDLLEDPRDADLPSRMAHVDELEADSEAALTGRTTAKWVERLDAAGVPGGPVLIHDQTLEDEHVLARGVVRETEHPVIGPMRILGSPMALSETANLSIPGAVARAGCRRRPA